VSSDDADEDDNEDDAKTPPPPSPPRVSSEVSGQIYNGRVIRDDTDDMVHHVVYHYFQAIDRGEAYQIPPELTEEEEELAVAILISEEEDKRAFPELADALVLSVAPLPPPRPPADVAAAHSSGDATSRGQGGAMGRLAQSCTRARRLSCGLPGR
jgi:hypothetical protein